MLLLRTLFKPTTFLPRTTPLRYFSSPENILSQQLQFEREIRTALAKLDRLSALLPDSDPKKQKSIRDLEHLNA